MKQGNDEQIINLQENLLMATQTENNCHLGHHYILLQKSRKVCIQVRSLKQDSNPAPTVSNWPFLDRGGMTRVPQKFVSATYL